MVMDMCWYIGVVFGYHTDCCVAPACVRVHSFSVCASICGSVGDDNIRTITAGQAATHIYAAHIWAGSTTSRFINQGLWVFSWRQHVGVSTTHQCIVRDERVHQVYPEIALQPPWIFAER